MLVHDFSKGGKEGWEEYVLVFFPSPHFLSFSSYVSSFPSSETNSNDQHLNSAQILHDTIRKTYGLHTALLPLFSSSPTAPPQFLQPPSQSAASLYSFVSPPPASPASVVGLGYDVPEGGAETQVQEGEGAEKGEKERREGHDLSDADLHALAKFTREFVVQSVVPWMERAVVVGNEQVRPVFLSSLVLPFVPPSPD